jgi:uncharacterized membrane protein affecting hemolysin expression
MSLLKVPLDSQKIRDLLHDLANNLLIIDANISQVRKQIEKDHPEMKNESTRLAKAEEYSKKAMGHLKGLKDFVNSEIKD